MRFRPWICRVHGRDSPATLVSEDHRRLLPNSRLTFTTSPLSDHAVRWGEAALCRAEFVEQQVHVPEGFEP
jgi:hypothetical protein